MGPIETFFTDSGIAVPAITADQMREVDRIAIEETGPNLYQMMENAGRNLAALAIDLLGSGWTKASVVVLAGKGGNGGGGICATRHLANRTLALPKTGPLPEKTGDLFLADIGIPAGVYERMGLADQSPFDDRFCVPLSTRPMDTGR